MNDLRAQLVPGWSGVNIGIMVLLFIVAAPLGILMLGYIIWGRQLGLDLSQPQSFAAAGKRLGRAFGAARQSWSGASPLPTGTPDGSGNPRSGSSGDPSSPTQESDTARMRTQNELDEDRAALEREKAAFEAEKRAFRQSKAES